MKDKGIKYELRYWLAWLFLGWAFKVCPLNAFKIRLGKFIVKEKEGSYEG